MAAPSAALLRPSAVSTHGQDAQPPVPRALTARTLRDLNTSSLVRRVAVAWESGPTAGRRVWKRPVAPPAIWPSRGVGGSTPATARRRSWEKRAGEQGGDRAGPGEAGAGAEAAAPLRAHRLSPLPANAALPPRGTHSWPWGCWPSVHTATGRRVSSLGDKRFLGRAGVDRKAGRSQPGAGAGAGQQ